MSFIRNLVDSSAREVRRYARRAETLAALEPRMNALSDDQLRELTGEFRQRLANGEPLDNLVEEAFAAVREAFIRATGMRPYDVQMIGGMVLHDGKIAEMKTGEGKTLVAVMPLYLNALPGHGAHLVTTNDYLVSWQSEWMGSVLRFLGMTVGKIQHDMDPAERRENYACDVTYLNNSELGFDYLRDNMAIYPEHLVLRDLSYAVVDEVDSILVDEARTPLIISGVPEQSSGMYRRVAGVVAGLRLEEEAKDREAAQAQAVESEADFLVNYANHTAATTEKGRRRIERALSIENLDDAENFELRHIVQTALKAQALFRKDVDYVVQHGEVIIVDEFTGRLQPGRRYSDGLHQTIEAKEGVRVEEERQTVASITYQNFFRLYDKLAGMTGTAKTEEPEFLKIYNMPVVVIPTDKPGIRGDHPDSVLKSGEAKFRAIVLDILAKHVRGQPVLVGTRSVDVSEFLASRLAPDKLQLQCLIRLVQERVRQSKDLPKDRREEYLQQLRPPLEELSRNTVRPIARAVNASMEALDEANLEELSKALALVPYEKETVAPAVGDWRDRLVNALTNGTPHNVLNAKYHFREAEIIAEAGRLGAVTIATNMAGRGVDIVLGGKPTEGQLQTEDAAQVIGLGGLAIVGTERHESRRIDNQLRGRAGRQGDPGSSRFYLALDDELMRLFGPERFGLLLRSWPEEEVLEARLVTRSIENAQKKVEARNFDQRKHTLQYDDVMNTQRRVIYGERRKVLMGEDLHGTILDMIEESCRDTVTTHFQPDPQTGKVEGGPVQLSEALHEALPGVNGALSAERLAGLDAQSAQEVVVEAARAFYRAKEQELGPELLREMERHILLQVIDVHWMQHLQDMDHLREAVMLRAYGQMDPLIQYHKEANQYFDRLLGRITGDTARLAFSAYPREGAAARRRRQQMQDLQEGTPMSEAAEEMQKKKPVRVATKPRRNDPCPCGSGKKYKKCCMPQ